MSRYDWERGEIILPPGAARKIRERLTKVESEHFDRVEAEIASFYEHKGSGGRTRDTFLASLREWDNKRRGEHLRSHGTVGYGGHHNETPRSLAFEDATVAAYGFAYRRAMDDNLGKPQKRDVKALRPKRKKTGPITFHVDDVSVGLDGNTMVWEVSEGNRAVDRAHQSPMGTAVFDELGKVQWTANTGGKIVGNDEYNRDSDWEDGGGNYVTSRFGPLGDPYFMSKQQQERVRQSAQTFRSKPGNAGLCGYRTMINGKQTGPPCRNSAYGCPAHRRR